MPYGRSISFVLELFLSLIRFFFNLHDLSQKIHTTNYYYQIDEDTVTLLFLVVLMAGGGIWSRVSSLWMEPPISDKDRILLTPFQQWRKYRHFPLKIVLHFLIVVFVSAQALMLSTEFIPYNRANETTFQSIFLPEDYRDGIFAIDDFIELLQHVVSNYYAFPEYSVNRYAFLYNPVSGGIEPIVMTVTRYQELGGLFWNHTYLNPAHQIDDNDFFGDFDTVSNRYELTKDNPVGIFDVSERNFELQNMFYYFTEITLQFSFRGINVGSFGVLPFIWDIQINFPFNGGMIAPKIYVTFRVTHTAGVSGFDIFTAMSSILLIFCLLSSLLSFQAIYHNVKVYRRLKHKYMYYSIMSEPSDPHPVWKSIPSSVKPHFFSIWSAFNIGGCFCIMIACILGLATEFGYNTSEAYYIVFGLGVMLSSMNMLRYFEYNKKFYLHVETLRNAAMHIIRFLISVSPMYWGYAIFGVLNFGPYSWKFANLDEASVTLFALLTGDDIHDTFKDIIEASYPVPWVSRVYIYSFVIIFITTVLNVFIFIIEDAYVLAKVTLGIYTLSDSDMIRTELSAMDSLRIIFHNLDNWKERMEENQKQKEIQNAGIPVEPCEDPDEIDATLEQIIPGINQIIEQNQIEYIREAEEKLQKCRTRFELKLKRDILRAMQRH